MDWDTYKTLCDQPDYWSRWMLEQSSILLHQLSHEALAQRLNAALASVPLEKPDDHLGPPETDMLRLDLGVDQRVTVLAVIKRACEDDLSTPGTIQRGSWWICRSLA